MNEGGKLKPLPNDPGLPQEIIFAAAGGVAALGIAAVAALAMRRRRQTHLRMTHPNGRAAFQSPDVFQDNAIYEMNGSTNVVANGSVAALQLYTGESTQTLPLTTTVNRGKSLSVSSRANRFPVSASATGLSSSEQHQVVGAVFTESTTKLTRKR